MKNHYFYFFVLISLLSCSPKFNFKSKGTIKLDAYQPKNQYNIIKSITTYNDFNKKLVLILDEKEYSINQFQSIIDTIKTNYRIIEILKNKKIKKIKIIRTE